jgi:hypothetical protein
LYYYKTLVRATTGYGIFIFTYAAHVKIKTLPLLMPAALRRLYYYLALPTFY